VGWLEHVFTRARRVGRASAVCVRVCGAAAAALGVSRDADEAAIKKAYRKLSLKYHPGATSALCSACDCGPELAATCRPQCWRRGRREAVPGMLAGATHACCHACLSLRAQEVAHAYEVLTDIEKRQIYDLEVCGGVVWRGRRCRPASSHELRGPRVRAGRGGPRAREEAGGWRWHVAVW
jgi:hypothetical protein